MPCILKVRCIQAKDLPVMDRTTDLTDAFVEVRFADFDIQKTNICRKSLNPTWNEDFRFEVSDDADLQNEPLELRVYDYDTISSKDPVGLVFIDLNPLLGESLTQISGWFPICDTLKGIRGEIMIQVKLQFFGDQNPFKNSSAGVKFFTLSQPPLGYQLISILGSADAMWSENDSEYHWAESFRTPRTSNEIRQKLLYQSSGHLRREIGKQVLEMGGNAVIGFQQTLDIEPKTRTIKAKAIGTACRIKESQSLGILGPARSLSLNSEDFHLPLPLTNDFLTLTEFPNNVLTSIGGLVCARSVKMLGTNDNREEWWDEVRDEIKAHARLLNCHFIAGYSESVSIVDDVCVLSAIGTAVNLSLANLDEHRHSKSDQGNSNPSSPIGKSSPLSSLCSNKQPCKIFHIPYKKHKSPFPMNYIKCNICKVKNVPEVILSTLALPKGIETIGQEVLIEAHVCRTRKRKENETNANAISDSIPFADYEIHNQLINKLKILGFNAIFSLEWKVQIGEHLIIAIASGTAYFLPVLPIPSELAFNTTKLHSLDEEDNEIIQIQNTITELSKENHIFLETKMKEKFDFPILEEDESGDSSSDSDTSIPEKDLSVLPMDDEADEDFLTILKDPILFRQLKIKTTCSNSRQEQFLVAISKQQNISSTHHPNRHLTSLIHQIYEELQVNSAFYENLSFNNVHYDIHLTKEFTVQIDFSCMAQGDPLSINDFQSNLKYSIADFTTEPSDASSDSDDSVSSFSLPDVKQMASMEFSPSVGYVMPKELDKVLISTGSEVFWPVEKNLGRFSLHFIQEDQSIGIEHMNKDISSFISMVKHIVFATIRSQILSLGGNAAIGVRFEQSNFSENYKDQAYGLVCVSGDIVELDME